MSTVDVPVRLDDLGEGITAVDDDTEPVQREQFAQLRQNAACFRTDIPVRTRGPPVIAVRSARTWFTRPVVGR